MEGVYYVQLVSGWEAEWLGKATPENFILPKLANNSEG